LVQVSYKGVAEQQQDSCIRGWRPADRTTHWELVSSCRQAQWAQFIGQTACGSNYPYQP